METPKADQPLVEVHRSKPRKTKAPSDGTKKRRRRPRAAAPPKLATPPTIAVDRDVCPAEQDRPDDFYLTGEWSLQCMPTKGETPEVWDTLGTSKDAESVYELWQEMRSKGWSNTKLRLVAKKAPEGGEETSEAIGLTSEKRTALVIDPDGRIVPDIYRTYQLARLTKKWVVELQTGATKVCLHEGTYRQCDNVYTREMKKKSAGTLVFLSPFGEVHKQQARMQFRQVLDVDKLEVDQKAPDVYNSIVAEKSGIVAKLRDKASSLLRKIASKVAP